ncbi:LysR family transcriptional regulator [Noviherbaspirillum sp.]|jgi:DNA-binding transcriptional LysR family regulator|uniref:LysR family transcriptional regulator n=1 Tax=Noviherbaspirillum sp. TaxID=1926288 RepID=UPI0025F1CE44|nr:LysR family transcriptional regulator [Noviherbaspirillum sp.]
MNLSRIDLNLFVVFNAIYTEGGITRASDTLKLSQPAISHALNRLRELLGDPLFIRKGNTMVPTAMAHELIGPIRRALGEIEGSLNQLSEFNPAESQREFKIGMRPIVESSLIPALIESMETVAPNVRISAVHYDRSDFQMQLATGALAAVIDIMQPITQMINHKHLGGGKMVVVARQGHPAVHGSISMETYLEQDHIVASSRRLGPALEDYELSRRGYQRRIKLRCQHYLTASHAVQVSNMLLTIPERFARAVNEGLGNQIVQFPAELPASDIFLYWHTNAENDPGNRWLREQIFGIWTPTAR